MSVRAQVVTVGLGCALALLPAGPALAACEAPSLTVSPAAASVGQTVTVSGRAWATACHDTGQPDPAPPWTGIPLSLASAPDVVLATVDADAGYAFTTQVVLPAGVPAGPTGLVVAVPATPSGTVHLAAVPFAVVSTEPPAELPRTSAPVAATAAVALACLLLGAAALRAGGTAPLRS